MKTLIIISPLVFITVGYIMYEIGKWWDQKTTISTQLYEWEINQRQKQRQKQLHRINNIILKNERRFYFKQRYL